MKFREKGTKEMHKRKEDKEGKNRCKGGGKVGGEREKGSWKRRKKRGRRESEKEKQGD